ncbi:MAG: hypothetical protein HYY52_02100 [Candidatus Melainabacteria bacterium]|nr:hypothetical protein [Candidatus Melainabacteria bacterium]
MLRKKEKEYKQEERKDFKFFVSVIFILLAFFFYKLEASVYATENEYSNINKLDKIEEKIYHETFKGETSEQRISRIEEFIFGKKYANENIETRINKITFAIEPEKKSEVKEVNEIKAQQTIIYDELFNTGVVGAISQLEKKVFNHVFNNLPFQARVSRLEEKMLSQGEILRAKQKPLIERISILVKKSGGLIPQAQTLSQVPPRNYTIDPKTGYLINQETSEIVKDSYGNPILVMIPEPLLLNTQPNYGGLPQAPYQFPNQPYGNQYGQNGQIPYDLLFNQGGYDAGDY